MNCREADLPIILDKPDDLMAGGWFDKKSTKCPAQPAIFSRTSTGSKAIVVSSERKGEQFRLTLTAYADHGDDIKAKGSWLPPFTVIGKPLPTDLSASSLN